MSYHLQGDSSLEGGSPGESSSWTNSWLVPDSVRNWWNGGKSRAALKPDNEADYSIRNGRYATPEIPQKGVKGGSNFQRSAVQDLNADLVHGINPNDDLGRDNMDQTIRDNYEGPIVEVQSVVKGTAHLPCDIKPPIQDDSVTLVVWYKNDVKPIYSLDSRGKVSEMGLHWKDQQVLEERSYFRTVTEPATLSIDNVQESDEAMYRCRVDFKTSPTRNHKVKLTVIVPPQKPTVFDDRGTEVVSVAGPYQEGAELKLTCVVSGGRPQPWVKWWRDSLLIDSTDTSAGFDNVRNNQLVVSRLERQHLNSVYTCEASNNNISQPVSTKINIEMELKPLSVTILTVTSPLSALKPVQLECESIGSRPAADISWWKDNQKLKNSVQTDLNKLAFSSSIRILTRSLHSPIESLIGLNRTDLGFVFSTPKYFRNQVAQDGNSTKSTLEFTPTIKDNGARLVCRADNPRISGAFLEDTRKLDIYYLPRLRLELGSKMNPEDIEDGDDVYFECKVDANPSAYKVIWKHNNKQLQHNQKGGVILSHKALALQSVKKTQAGNYTCVASNVEGDGESNMVSLKVMYTPICRPDQKKVFGVARNEDARVMCEVDAFPPPDDFKWTFNNSAESLEIGSGRYQNSLHLSLSTLSYTPQNEMDYGTVMCWASNTAGRQRDPCVFHIIPAGKPDMPYNCTISNQTSTSLDVECLDAFDGGQPQKFQLEVYDQETHLLLVNRTSRHTSFHLGNLVAGSSLKMKVYAFNSKGKSEPVFIEGYTLKVAAKQTGPQTPFAVTPVILILVVATVVLVTCTVIVFGVLRVRSSAAGRSPNITSIGFKDKSKAAASGDTRDMYDPDDNNPDIIPSTRDNDYQLVDPKKSSTNSAIQTLGCTSDMSPSSFQVGYQGLTLNGANNGDLYENYKNMYHQPHEDQLFNELGVRHSSLEPISYPAVDQPVLTPGSLPPHREVISVRTPLMASQQESCV